MRAPLLALLLASPLVAGCVEGAAAEAAPPPLGRCDDGILSPDELCDASAEGSPPCRPGCRLDLCGDGVLEAPEACEPALEPPGRCTDGCEWSRCGDGVRDADEACDEGPGNGEASPSCTQSCTIPRCGDGLVSPRTGEQCEGDVDCAACRLTACAVTHVAASSEGLLLVRSDGALFVTGDLSASGLAPWIAGTDGFANATTPVPFPGAPAFVKLTSRHGAGAGLTAEGRLFTFGASPFGQRGDGTVVMVPATAFTEPLPAERFRDVAATARGVLALGVDGRAWAFGGDGTGELGPIAEERQSCPLGEATVPCRPTAVRTLAERDGLVRLYAGESSKFVPEPRLETTATIALDREGRAWGFGSDAWGQLGHDTDATETCPDGSSRCWLTPTSLLDEPVVDVAVNEKAAVLLRRDGVLVGLGAEDALGLSQDALAWDWQPVTLLVPGGLSPASLSGSANFFAVRTHDGRLVSFGDNIADRVAIGAGRRIVAPMLATVPLGSPIVEVATGYWTTVVRLQDGRAFAWGDGINGRLGDGVAESHLVAAPVEVRVCP